MLCLKCIQGSQNLHIMLGDHSLKTKTNSKILRNRRFKIYLQKLARQSLLSA